MLASSIPAFRSAASASALRAVRSTPLARSVAVATPFGSSVRGFASSRVALEIKTRYTPEHEWVAFDTESNIGTIGITDYAQKSLGDVVYVELPSEDTDVKQGGELRGDTHSTLRQSD